MHLSHVSVLKWGYTTEMVILIRKMTISIPHVDAFTWPQRPIVLKAIYKMKFTNKCYKVVPPSDVSWFINHEITPMNTIVYTDTYHKP